MSGRPACGAHPDDSERPIVERALFDRVALDDQPAPPGWRSVKDGFMRAAELRAPTPAARPLEAAPGERWIDVDTQSQTLAVYDGDVPRFITLISTGQGRPGTRFSTPRGTFRINYKIPTATMDNVDEKDGVPPYSFEEVPWVQYFHKEVALHGAYWHQRFGHPVSHGCVNLSPARCAARLCAHARVHAGLRGNHSEGPMMWYDRFMLVPGEQRPRLWPFVLLVALGLFLLRRRSGGGGSGPGRAARRRAARSKPRLINSRRRWSARASSWFEYRAPHGVYARMKIAWAILALIGCGLDAGAGEAGPPASALHWADAALDQDQVRVTLRPVADRAWQEAPPAGRVQWDDWALFWKVRRDSSDLIAPLVPLSSVQVSIENRGVEPLLFPTPG